MTSDRADKQVIDTHTRTQATTIPGGQNWPWVKTNEGGRAGYPNPFHSWKFQFHYQLVKHIFLFYSDTSVADDLDEANFKPDYEECEDASAPEKPKKKKLHPCQCCEKRLANLKKHCLNEHLPFFIIPYTACWSCKIQCVIENRLTYHRQHAQCSGKVFSESGINMWCQAMSSLLLVLADLHACEQVHDLSSVLERCDMSVSNSMITEQDRKLLRAYDTYLGEKHVEFNFQPINCVASLTHWRILVALISNLSVGKEYIKNFLPPGDRPQAVDSHFHLDVISRELSIPSIPFQGVLDFHKSDYDILGAVANCVYPLEWPSKQSMDMYSNDPRLFFSFGVHPHKSKDVTDNTLNHLSELLALPKVVAVGECGLDYSGRPETEEKKQQQELFRQQLLMAKSKDLPVIIHCRDFGNNTDACADTIEIMKPILPVSHPIHRHCFNGTTEEKDFWMENFPNTKFGFTSMIIQMARPSHLNVITELPWNHILLETDSPYLPPRSYHYPLCARRRQFKRNVVGTPGMLGPIAARVAQLRECSIDEVWRRTTTNAAVFYGMFWTITNGLWC